VVGCAIAITSKRWYVYGITIRVYGDVVIQVIAYPGKKGWMNAPEPGEIKTDIRVIDKHVVRLALFTAETPGILRKIRIAQITLVIPFVSTGPDVGMNGQVECPLKIQAGRKSSRRQVGVAAGSQVKAGLR
jgi:hypothetical protein